MNASPSEKNMKTVLVLLLAALLGHSEAEYRRTVSYEGEVVVRWYVSSVIVTTACRRNFDHFARSACLQHWRRQGETAVTIRAQRHRRLGGWFRWRRHSHAQGLLPEDPLQVSGVYPPSWGSGNLCEEVGEDHHAAWSRAGYLVWRICEWNWKSFEIVVLLHE